MIELPTNQLVVDASVAVQWYIEDEPYAVLAESILTAFGDGHVALVAPQHIHYEVSNALRTAVHRGRISDDLGRRVTLDFLQLDIPLVVGTHLIVRGWDAAHTYDCALYDGLYLALAEMTGSPLVHADRRLHNSLQGRFPLELWIEDLSI